MPADPSTLASSTASSGSAPTWPPTWTACQINKLAGLLSELLSHRR
jgi:hypothetical protein